MELLEEKNITDVSQGDDKAKWISDNYSNIRSFTEHDIEKITNNYSTLIGKGGFGEVFRGVLDDEDDVVAVKRYIRGDLRDEFMEEVRIHAQMSHKNIVKLIGYCIGENTLTMVTEFISNGNLEDALHNSDIPIPLNTRLGIAIGCAEALSYMHSMHLSSGNLICHGDIKPANILLDASFTAKLSDFGISKSLSGGITRWTSNVKGSIAYMDPVYYREGRVTSKNDVYSFGAILLELIAQKSMKEGGISYEAFRQACAKGKGLRELLDIEIAEECNMSILEEIAKLATKCMIVDSIKKRPQMNDVAEHLRTWIFEVRNGGHEKEAWVFTLKIQNALKKGYMQSAGIFSTSSMANHKKQNFGIFRSNDVRIFTKEDLSGITENYSHLLGKGAFCDVYKGTLDDNTLVAVKTYSDQFFCDEHLRNSISTSTTIMSQIAHKYIIKLLGLCFDAELPILIYEYAPKGSLNDILHSEEDFPLEIRLKIAVKTAEALEFLHSSAFCAIRHGNVKPSNILLDSNLMPKVAGFTSSRRIVEDNNDQVASMEFAHIHYMDPIHIQSGHFAVKNDVYSFGVVLLEFISRKKPVYHYHDKNRGLIPEFVRAYKTAKSGKAMFDERIRAKEDIAVLEEIGRLAMECVRMEIDERPTMKEVAERLTMIRTNRARTTQPW